MYSVRWYLWELVVLKLCLFPELFPEFVLQVVLCLQVLKLLVVLNFEYLVIFPHKVAEHPRVCPRYYEECLQ